MKIVSTLVLLALIGPMCLAKGTKMLPLDENVPEFALPDSTGKIVQYQSFLGKNRILLIAVPEATDTQAAAYLERARAERGEYEERDTVLLMIVPAASPLAKQPSDHAIHVLRDRTGATLAALGASGKSAVSYLIGKDRGIKRAGAGFLPADALFAAIDSMPMRKREMRERR